MAGATCVRAELRERVQTIPDDSEVATATREQKSDTFCCPGSLNFKGENMENYVPKLGQVASEMDRRDAIHIAVAPVVAAEDLEPGAHVGKLENGEFSTEATKLIGIVDPFLKEAVKKGQQFWLLVYPGTVTGMRHSWRHPEFDYKPWRKA